MKRKAFKLIVTSFVIVLMLTCVVSCNIKPVNRSVTPSQSYTCTVSLEYNGMNIVADVDHPSTGICTLKVTEPSSLKGVGINWEAGEMSVSYMGLKFDIDQNSFPQTAFIPHVMDVLDRISSTEQLELDKDETGEECIYEGTCEAGTFTAEIDHETGVIRSISIPDYGIYVIFSNFNKY